MLGFGLGLNKGGGKVTGGDPVEERPALSDEYIFTDNNLYGWSASGISGQLVSGDNYAAYEDNSTTNLDHRIIRSSYDAELYIDQPNDIYYKIRVFRGDISQNLTGIFRVSAFGKALTLDEADRELPFATEKTYTGVIQDVVYSNQYYYIDFHKDPSEYDQKDLTGGFMAIYSIQFANYDLSA